MPLPRAERALIMKLDLIDRKLLNLLQAGFPLVPEPYRELGEALGISEEEVIARIGRMLQSGVIRRLGCVFDSRQLGYSGVLCAMNVEEGRVDEVAEVVNSFPGITHNYLREHPRYNMWFTLLAGSDQEIEAILEQIRERTGIKEVIALPAEDVFKIRVSFDLE